MLVVRKNSSNFAKADRHAEAPVWGQVGRACRDIQSVCPDYIL